MMRRCVLLLVSLLTLAATASCGTAAAPVSVPGVSGRLGSDPVVTIPGGTPSRQLIVRTVVPGRGPVVRPGDYVLFNVQGKVWAGDREIMDSYTNRQPQGLPLTSALPAWRHLAGQRIGSRVLMVVPPRDGFGRLGDPQANVMPTDTLVFVFDLLGAVPERDRATGTALPYHPGAGQPTVRWAGQGPVITAPRTARPPARLVRTVLVRGHGHPILNGQTVVVHYTGVVWRTGKVFASSWAHGYPQAFQLGGGQVIPGWDEGLGGLPVGSRVLLVVPPALGYGRAGNPPLVGAHDTLVFVIDILSAV